MDLRAQICPREVCCTPDSANNNRPMCKTTNPASLPLSLSFSRRLESRENNFPPNQLEHILLVIGENRQGFLSRAHYVRSRTTPLLHGRHHRRSNRAVPLSALPAPSLTTLFVPKNKSTSHQIITHSGCVIRGENNRNPESHQSAVEFELISSDSTVGPHQPSPSASATPPITVDYRQSITPRPTKGHDHDRTQRTSSSASRSSRKAKGEAKESFDRIIDFTHTWGTSPRPKASQPHAHTQRLAHLDHTPQVTLESLPLALAASRRIGISPS
ncbi:hypothetical protein CIHG_06978 [Coccidioides immitis H538.4]|uniref:Uncharacterized protein n=1 Tax=Coccidioides immitis H538.4 TaxID=396776 RepID=A0A0J8RXK4_COCIT|nr:hypothetical protein CIHG_06978 [Coccidioides immitis H538.4]